MSVDGFIAMEDDRVGPLPEWFETGDAPLYENGPLVTRQSHDYYQPMLDAIGALVVGRHVFELTDGWGAKSPAGDHCVVVSHRPAPERWDPAAPFHFVDNLGVRAVAIPRKGQPGSARRDTEHRRSFRRLVKWRTGCEGRIAHLKRRSGWDRTMLDGLTGTRIWCGHGVFTHYLSPRSALWRHEQPAHDKTVPPQQTRPNIRRRQHLLLQVEVARERIS